MKAVFSGNENHFITKAGFDGLVRRYQALPAKPSNGVGGYVSKEALKCLLAHPDAIGLRYYYGLTETQTPGMLWVASSKKGADLIEENFIKLAGFSPKSPQNISSFVNKDYAVSIDDAVALTTRYQQQIDENSVKAGFFGRDALHKLLDQDSCNGINFYYGMSADEARVLLLVGVDEKHEELQRGILLEYSVPCPPWCAAESVLAGTISAISTQRLDSK